MARDEGTRELADKVRDGLAVRQEKEHQEWLADIDTALGVGRVVRALRLSSRPPKAGVRFPPELGTRLAEAAGGALTADVAPDRWGAVLEAVAYSPVRAGVTPAGYPTTVTDELRAMVTSVASLVPTIAAHFGVEPPPAGARAGRPARRAAPARRPKSAPGGSRRPIPPPPTLAPEAAPAEAGTPEAAPPETEPSDTAPAEAATPEAAPPEAAPPEAEPSDTAPAEAATPEAAPPETEPSDTAPPPDTPLPEVPTLVVEPTDDGM